MADIGKREDRMLEAVKRHMDGELALQKRIDTALALIEEATLARRADPVLDQLWLTLR